jgi:phosphatidylinositol glycan class B
MGGARKSHLGLVIVSAIVPVAAALLVDRWGYGVWSFPPWNYVEVNLIGGWAVQTFGRSPFYAYAYLLPANIFLPIAILLLVAMIVACARNPRHFVSWTSAPFLVVHSFLAHKEERFLFPLAIIATSYPVLAFSPSGEKLFDFFGRLWSYRRSALARFVAWSSVAAMAILAVYPLGIRPHMPMAEYLYRNFPNGLHAYTLDREPFLSYPMYRPPVFRSESLHSRAELDALLDKGIVYLISETPTLPANSVPDRTRVTLVYSEFPLASGGWASLGTGIMCRYAELLKSAPLKTPRLAWFTLFRLRRDISTSQEYERSNCIPVWNVSF